MRQDLIVPQLGVAVLTMFFSDVRNYLQTNINKVRKDHGVGDVLSCLEKGGSLYC